MRISLAGEVGNLRVSQPLSCIKSPAQTVTASHINAAKKPHTDCHSQPHKLQQKGVLHLAD